MRQTIDAIMAGENARLEFESQVTSAPFAGHDGRIVLRIWGHNGLQLVMISAAEFARIDKRSLCLNAGFDPGDTD